MSGPPTLVGAALVLCVAVAVGVVAHELLHAAVLHLLGIRYDLTVGVGRVGIGNADADTPGALGRVVPLETAPDGAAWKMRLSAIAPLVLAVPVLAVGVVPAPLPVDDPLFTAWAVGWLACAIPSPQDFSVFFHADRALAARAADSAGR